MVGMRAAARGDSWSGRIVTVPYRRRRRRRLGGTAAGGGVAAGPLVIYGNMIGGGVVGLLRCGTVARGAAQVCDNATSQLSIFSVTCMMTFLGGNIAFGEDTGSERTENESGAWTALPWSRRIWSDG